jgi:hypothetical protein
MNMNVNRSKVWVCAEIVAAMGPEELVPAARTLHRNGFLVVMRPDCECGDAVYADAYKLVDVAQAAGVYDEVWDLFDGIGYGDLVECGQVQEHKLPWASAPRPIRPENIRPGVKSLG